MSKLFPAFVLCIAVSLAWGAGAGGAIEIRNRAVRATVSTEARGAIVSVIDHASGVEFASPQTAGRLFSLALLKKGEPVGQPNGQPFYLTSRDAKHFAADMKDGVITLSYDGLGDWPIRVTCTASVNENDPLIRWRLAATIPDTLILHSVQFPCVTLRTPLDKSDEADAAVFGHTKGGVIRRPGAMKVGWRASGRQPGSLAAQFGCYYNDRAGFYLAAYDGKGYPKDFEMKRTADGLEMSWIVHCYASGSFALDFDVVMSTFASADKDAPTDWRDAADLYKTWAMGQPWCATPYADRKDIPVWMKAGPAMVRFGRDWLADPARIERWLNEHWKKHFADAPLITAYWGWEKVGGWITPDYFPVFPSDEQFTKLVARSHEMGCHAFPWPSGYHWTLTYRKQADGSFYWDDRKRFDTVGRPHAVVARDGKLYNRTPSWLAGGDTACLCPGDPWTINWWNNDISVPLVRRGCEMVQVDQVVGGAFPFCYSPDHGHAPGPGLWMTEVFTEQLRSMYAAMKKIEPDAVVCFEEPNERFNHLVGIQDYRDCESPHEWASVFNYLYHEFLPTFQSNPRGGDAVMAAHCVVTGQMPHMRPQSSHLEEPLLVNGEFERRAKGDGFAGWDQVHAYNGRQWNGKAIRDEAEKHGGASSLRLENSADDDIVQVSQNVSASKFSGGLAVGKTYRLSAWLKTEQMARPSSINFGFLGPKTTSMGKGGRLPFPIAGSGWARVAADFTVPDGAELLRIMIHIEGKARAWVDDMTLDELLPDGTTRQVRASGLAAETQFMRRWVELYHGQGRPWLQFGKTLHPPKLTCAAITYRDRTMPAVLHEAYRSPDGQDAVILANASQEPQSVTLMWKGQERKLELKPGEIRLER